MKSILLFLLPLIISSSSFAQRNVPMKNLWTRPQVHVLFEGYTISFSLKDINKALGFLADIGDTTYGRVCRMDTAGNFFTELYPVKMEYHNSLQPLLQNGVGAYLLSAGHATIENARHKRVSSVTMDIVPLIEGTSEVSVMFYDPDSGKMIFSGKMEADLYNKDLGID